jgi:hypothetical protein
MESASSPTFGPWHHAPAAGLQLNSSMAPNYRGVIVKREPRPHSRPCLFSATGLLAAVSALGASAADASLLSGEALDTAANVVSWAVLILVPIIGITVFWLVHVLPEKIAHKRHHPQAQAIHTLCLLSLVFGGLLWPIAWLWAYTRPVAFKAAYGTDKHESYFDEAGAKVRSGTLVEDEVRRLKDELDVMHAKGVLTGKLAQLRDDIAALEGRTPVAEARGA